MSRLAQAKDRILDGLTLRARRKLPEDDPLHYLHVTPLQRKKTDPAMFLPIPDILERVDRIKNQMRSNPGEVVTKDLSTLIPDDEFE